MQMLVRPIDSERDLCWVEEFNILAGELEEGIQGGEEVERCSPCLGPGNIRKLIDPRLPSQREVDEHNLTHLPYRSWCPICIQAKGKEMDHRRDDGKDRRFPEYSWDFCFPGDEMGYKWTVLVGR